MTKKELEFDDACAQFRLATAAVIEENPHWLTFTKGSGAAKRTAVAEVGRVTTLLIGLGGWLSWSDAFVKLFEIHTDFRIVHKDDVSQNDAKRSEVSRNSYNQTNKNLAISRAENQKVSFQLSSHNHPTVFITHDTQE